MRRRRSLFVGLALLVLLAGLGVTQQVLEKTAAAQSKAAVQAPRRAVHWSVLAMRQPRAVGACVRWGPASARQ